MANGSYLKLTTRELGDRVQRAVALLERCTVCAQECRVDRLRGEKGICRGGRYAVVNSYGPHFGEEAPLVGIKGSGTIFFAYCNLKCSFCQNCEISQNGEGDVVSASELAGIMLELQEGGCHNINLVSPSHFAPQFLEALVIAVGKGLIIPIVFNTGGYDSPAMLEILNSVIDVYMPDIKFGDDDAGMKYTGAAGYFTVVKRAVKKMHEHVGDLVLDESGLATRGLLVRHLVLPEDLTGTANVMEFLSQEISVNTFVNIMNQYYPAYKSLDYPELGRRITHSEYRAALKAAKLAGLTRIYK